MRLLWRLYLWNIQHYLAFPADVHLGNFIHALTWNRLLSRWKFNQKDKKQTNPDLKALKSVQASVTWVYQYGA